MFTLLIAATLGAYASQRISLIRDGEIASAAVDYQRVWSDAIAFFTFLGAFCDWFIATGRSARTYFNLALLPWLSDRGIDIKLPAIDLPKLPTANLQTD